MKSLIYKINTEWTGNLGLGTMDYKSYGRNFIISGDGKNQRIPGSSDPSYRGDPAFYNPEDLFVSSLSTCHMLWYLHLCAINGVIIMDYIDNAVGVMEETESGSGKFKEVVLHPEVTVSEHSMTDKAISLHAEAGKMCFIANSCNFPVKHEPKVTVIA